ncbi:MAG TPA: ATP synthase F1 subunit delta [Candidatus Binataceae bacterium]|nr:ATP synthase F1 subunit delta [Candidatus Binataceae bacterium]
MKGSRVAKRYARALIGLAEKGQLESWGAELHRLAEIVQAPELMAVLTSPELGEDARREAMAKIAEKLELSFPLRSFAVVLARHGRIGEIGAIAESYGDQVDEILGRARATLTFAMPPSDAEVARLTAALESIANKKIISTVRVDNSLLGGVVAELSGKIYDGSLATQLAEAERRLAGQT